MVAAGFSLRRKIPQAKACGYRQAFAASGATTRRFRCETSMKIAVIGSAGQLGRALVSRLPGEVVALERKDADITDRAATAGLLATHSPNVVVRIGSVVALEEILHHPGIDRAAAEFASRLSEHTAAPAEFVNCRFPAIAVSVGFTRKTCVVQPPPSAKCGTTEVPLFGGAVVSMTGSVDIRKSPRSLMKPRSATTATGTLDVKLNVPRKVGVV